LKSTHALVLLFLLSASFANATPNTLFKACLLALKNPSETFQRIRQQQAESQRPVAIIVDAISSGVDYAQQFRGHRIIHVRSQAVIIDPKRYSIREKDFDQQHVYTGDLRALVKELGLSRRQKVSVVAGAEEGVQLVHSLSLALKAPTNPQAAPHTWGNKYETLKFLKDNGVDVGDFAKIQSWAELEEWAIAHGRWPIVLKPIQSAGTDGVFINNNLSELKRAYSKLINTNDSLGHLNSSLLAMEYLEGTEYAVDLTYIDGEIKISDVLRYERPLVEGASTKYDYDRLIPFDYAQRLELISYAEKIVKLLGMQVAHFEIKITPNGPRLVEVAPRPIGGRLTRLVQIATGRNQITLAAQGLTDTPAYRNQSYRYPMHQEAAAVFITSNGGKRLSLAALEKLKQLPGFVSAEFAFNEGDLLPRTIDADSTAGQIFLAHEDPFVLERSLIEVRRMRDAGEFEYEDLSD